MAKDGYSKYRPEKKSVLKIEAKVDPEIAEAVNALLKMKGEDAIDIGMFLGDALRRAGIIKVAEDLTGFDKNSVEK